MYKNIAQYNGRAALEIYSILGKCIYSQRTINELNIPIGLFYLYSTYMYTVHVDAALPETLYEHNIVKIKSIMLKFIYAPSLFRYV